MSAVVQKVAFSNFVTRAAITQLIAFAQEDKAISIFIGFTDLRVL